MNTEVYDNYIVSNNHMADAMPSGLTLYMEDMSGSEVAYTLVQADGQGVTWARDITQGPAWMDTIVRNAVRNETDLHRLSQLLDVYGIESHWCNHVQTPATIKETTITVVRPVPQDGDDNKLPARYYVIKESPLGLTWVNTYTWTDRVRATDHDAAMDLIRDMEQQEQN